LLVDFILSILSIHVRFFFLIQQLIGKVTADPNPGHSKKAHQKIQNSTIPVECQQLHGGRLPFDDH
jgi:hypothetical protein